MQPQILNFRFLKIIPRLLGIRRIVLSMKRKTTTRTRSGRRGIAAVEAAICLPVLIAIWLGTVEITRTLTLKQQSQLFASAAAARILDTNTPLQDVESNIELMAKEFDVLGVDVSVTRFDNDLVEASVSINIDQNSSLGTLFPGRSVASTYYTFRKAN